MKPSSGMIWPFNKEVTSWARKAPGARTWTYLLLLALKNLEAIVSSFLSFIPVCVLLSWQM